jgi:hypothetical protein
VGVMGGREDGRTVGREDGRMVGWEVFALINESRRDDPSVAPDVSPGREGRT